MVLPTPLQAFSSVPKAAAGTDKQTIADGEKMTGAEALVRSLEDLGVQDVFGIPGGAILPVYHAIKDDSKFRFLPAMPPRATPWRPAVWACAS